MPILNQPLNTLINKYNVSGPRYTSYPTALQFREEFSLDTYIKDMCIDANTPLSLYIHIPFCHQLCYYCGCNKTVTRHKHKADEYLDYLDLEVSRLAPLFKHRKLLHLHLGGGTPTFLDSQQMARLISTVRSNFDVERSPKTEWSIEIDPRSVDCDYLSDLRELGFNRLSFGLQDFDFDVQAAINRVQDYSDIKRLFSMSKALQFKSINADMIYGLPLQTPESFKSSIMRLLELSPDRVSVFNYAHLPSSFAAQRKIPEGDLPSANQKVQMFTETIATLEHHGYRYIGIDHFAKDEDTLSIAQQKGELHRNFQGYTTHADTDLLGMGVSSISQIGSVIIQNPKNLKQYYSAFLHDKSHTPFLHYTGLVCNKDDTIRAFLIKDLMCHYRISISALSQKFSIDPLTYFQSEFSQLKEFVDDKILQETADGYKVNNGNYLFIRNIAMCFDRYLSKQLKIQKYSRVI